MTAITPNITHQSWLGNWPPTPVDSKNYRWPAFVYITLLASDANEQPKLLVNIDRSIHIYDKGLGELPVGF